MYKLYTDKGEVFEASIELSGAKLDKTSCRIILESNKLNLVFSGDVNRNGDCRIPISKMKDILDEGTTGTMKMEIIAEDTYFVPWESTFQVETNKKVTVEVKEQKNTTSRPNVIVSNVKAKKEESKVDMIVNELKANNVSKRDVLRKTRRAKRIINENISDLDSAEKRSILKQILKSI